MITANIHNAKTNLSKLINMALEGEEVIIGKAGKQLVKLVPMVTANQRHSGSWKDRIKISDDFEILPDDIQKYFDGEE